MSIRGIPAKVVSDRGTQLTLSTNVVAFSTKEDPANWDWDEVRSKTVGSDTEWEFVKARCQYRNGLAERRVMVLKRMLDHLLANALVQNKPTLGYTDLQVLLQQAANITNDRPVGLHELMEDELVPLTVNQMLLGRNSNQPSNYDEEGELHNLEFLKEYLRNLLEAWWTEWRCQGFPHLLPYYTKTTIKKHPNLEVGDVCQLQYKTKVTKHYRLCIILEVKTSEDGVVWTVMVGLWNR